MVRNRNVTPVLSAKYLFMVCVLCFLLFGCGFSGLFAQTSIKAELQLEKVDLPPAYKGGEQQFIEFLQKEIHYPADARAYGVETLVTVHFAIDESGKIQNPEAKIGRLHLRKQHTELDGYTGVTQKQESERWWAQIRKEIGSQMEHEVLRSLLKSRKWKPGKKEGKKTEVKGVLKVYFLYADDKVK